MGSNAAYPNDLKIRADVNRWLFWESASWFPACYFYLVENCIKPLLGGATDEAAVAAHNAHFHKLASILDARLAHNTWVAGTASATIADIALASPMHLHGWQKMPLEPHANVRRWLTESVEALPCWQSTWVGEGFTIKQAA